MKQTSKRPSAFTLIELLVAIVLMAVLAVIAFNVGQGAINSARNAECGSRLRAIGVGLASYANDNGGKLPPSAMLSWRAPYYFQRQTYWFDALNPYMGYPEYAATRSEPFPEPTEELKDLPLKWQLCPAKNVKPRQRQSVGYGWNATHFGWDNSRPGTGLDRYLARIPEPSNTIIVGDSKDEDVRLENQNEHRYIYDYQKENRIPYPRRHSGGGNYLFADGHVGHYPAEFMSTIEGIRLFRYDK